jgi:hypothetical protein
VIGYKTVAPQNLQLVGSRMQRSMFYTALTKLFPYTVDRKNTSHHIHGMKSIQFKINDSVTIEKEKAYTSKLAFPA